jgi:hypothetical protein
MLKDTILSYINDDGNLVYINDLVSAFDNWQSALGIFLGASNYKFIDISMSNEMDAATFTSGTTQLIFKTSSSLPSLATGTIIIATCNKTFTVTEQNRATVYVWLSDVEQRSSETGQEYTAIKRALFSNTQPTGISEVATIDLTWAVGMDGYSFYHTYDWRANLVLPSSIGLSDIANGAVGTLKIADGAVTSEKIADGTISTPDIANGAITSEKIADGTISTPDIANGAITSAKIGDYQVTERNIGLGSISNDALQSKSVTEDKLNVTPYFLGVSYSGITIKINNKQATVEKDFNTTWAGTESISTAENSVSVNIDINSGYRLTNVVYAKKVTSEEVNMSDFSITMSYDNSQLYFFISNPQSASNFTLDIDIIALVKMV